MRRNWVKKGVDGKQEIEPAARSAGVSTNDNGRPVNPPDPTFLPPSFRRTFALFFLRIVRSLRLKSRRSSFHPFFPSFDDTFLDRPVRSCNALEKKRRNRKKKHTSKKEGTSSISIPLEKEEVSVRRSNVR